MSRYQQPIKEVGSCRVYEEQFVDIRLNNIKKFSKFCNGKQVTNMNEIARGGYGTIYNLNINGVDYVLKKQDIEIDNPLSEMEKEVSIPDLLKNIRRQDGQRISIPIFDCFFICERGTLTRSNCEGEMFFIMEKGAGNCAELIVKRDGIFSTPETKVVLLRDMLIKMIENIYLLVNEAKYVWWDLKPGNTVYNFKLNPNTNKVEINPILIDLDERYLSNKISDLLNVDKLNYLLGNLEFGGSPIFPYKLEEHHIRRLYAFIMCFSYIFYFMDIFRENQQYTGSKIYDMVLGLSLFNKRRIEDDETITPYDILRIMFNPKKEDVWLNTSLQILLRTDFADSTTANSKSSAFRTQFHHYSTHGVVGTYDIRYNFLLQKFKAMYIKGVSELREPIRYNQFFLSFAVIGRVKQMMDRRGELRRYMNSIRDRTDEDIENLFMVNSELVPEAGNLRVQGQNPRSRSLFRFLGI